MTNIKHPRLHNIHVRNVSGEIDDNNVDTSAKRNKNLINKTKGF